LYADGQFLHVSKDRGNWGNGFSDFTGATARDARLCVCTAVPVPPVMHYVCNA